MTRNEAMDKVRKLLELANSDNEHEAAAAAARAQAIMDRYQIETAMLGAAIESEDEAIVDFESDPLEDADGKTPTALAWRSTLVHALVKANACQMYTWADRSTSQRQLYHVVGRPSDVAIVRYLFAYCSREIDRLAKQKKGHGRSWILAYRLGCAQAVRQAIEREKEALRSQMYADAHAAPDSTALVALDNALARVEERSRSTEAWMAANVTATTKGGGFVTSQAGVAAGRREGRDIYPGRSGGRQVAAGARQLKG